MSGMESKLKKDAYKLTLKAIADLTGGEVSTLNPMVPLLSVISLQDVDYILQQIMQEDVEQTIIALAEAMGRNKRTMINNDTTIGQFCTMLAGSSSIMTSYASSTPPP